MLKIQRLNEGKVQTRSTVFAHTVIVVFGTEMLWKVDLFLYFLTEVLKLGVSLPAKVELFFTKCKGMHKRTNGWY